MSQSAILFHLDRAALVKRYIDAYVKFEIAQTDLEMAALDHGMSESEVRHDARMEALLCMAYTTDQSLEALTLTMEAQAVAQEKIKEET